MFMRSVVWYMIFSMFLIGIAPRVEGGLSPSEAVALAQADRGADLETIREVLESKKVSDRLEKLGFTAEEVQSRLDRLSDGQIHELAQRLDDIRVAGDGVGVLVVLLLIAIFIVLWLNYTGRKVIITN
ncbi:MAG: hypothetical protein Kow0025_05940 [Thermodesulfovibrionales bacterium]